MATTTHPKVHCASGSLTLGEVNAYSGAGTIIVNPSRDRTLTVIDGWLRSPGHNAAGSTAVIVTTTEGSPTTVVSATVGALTAETVARFGDSNVTFTAPNAALTKGTGLRIGRTTGDLTTSHSLDYCIYYTVTV